MNLHFKFYLKQEKKHENCSSALQPARHYKGSGENLLAILPRVKELGYDGVEFAGYFGVDAATLRTALDSAGLVAVGTHIAIESYSPENFDKTAEFCRTLGMKTMGMGGADHETPRSSRRPAPS